MKTLRTLLVAAAVAIGGGMSPVTGPAQAHGAIYYEIHYFGDGDPGMNYEVGNWIIYCDEHESHWGHPDIYSWQAYYDCP